MPPKDWFILAGSLLLLLGALYASWSTRSQGERAEGIGGWLLLLAIVQSLAPLRSLAATAEQWADIDVEALSRVPGAVGITIGALLLDLAFLALVTATTIALWRKSPHFPDLFLIQWIATIVFPIVSMLRVSHMIEMHPVEPLHIDLVGPLATALAGAAWSIYLAKSSRVRNTFLRPE